MNITPLRLSRIYLNLLLKCNRCKTQIGYIFHMFWKCKYLINFWSFVYDFMKKKNLNITGWIKVTILLGTECAKISFYRKRYAIIVPGS